MPRTLPPQLKAFQAAAKSEGYLQKGSFKPLPKKGTAAYKKIMTEAGLKPSPACKKGKSCGKACIKRKTAKGKRTICHKKKRTKRSTRK